MMFEAVYDWLWLPIDTSRPHDVSFEVAWHGRLMVLAWSFLFPVGILSARFFKIWFGQKWPLETDSQIWWRTHLTTQYLGGIAVVLAMYLIWRPWGETVAANVHRVLGWVVVFSCLMQFIAGWLRGTHGGPQRAAMGEEFEGDHYLMTPRRRVFEYMHKIVGYMALLAAVLVTLTGLWISNGPRWMWIVIIAWWVVLAVLFTLLQKRGWAIDTYQAIFGPDPSMPGNQRRPIGIGIRRPNMDLRDEQGRLS